MKKIVLPVLFTLTVLLLSACSIIESLIPDQEIDMLGSSGEEELVLPATFVLTEEPDFSDLGDEGSTALQSQASGQFIPFVIYRGFDDFSEPVTVYPKTLEQGVKLAELVLERENDTTVFPDTFSLRLAGVNLNGYYSSTGISIWDGYIGNDITGYDSYLESKEEIRKSQREADENGRSFDASLKVDAKADYLYHEGAFVPFIKNGSCTSNTCSYSFDKLKYPQAGFWFRMSDYTSTSSATKTIVDIASPSEYYPDVYPKNSVLIYGSYKVLSEDFDPSLKVQLVFDFPKAVASFKD